MSNSRNDNVPVIYISNLHVDSIMTYFCISKGMFDVDICSHVDKLFVAYRFYLILKENSCVALSILRVNGHYILSTGCEASSQPRRMWLTTTHRPGPPGTSLLPDPDPRPPFLSLFVHTATCVLMLNWFPRCESKEFRPRPTCFDGHAMVWAFYVKAFFVLFF